MSWLISYYINALLASNYFRHLLNKLSLQTVWMDPDQVRHNVGPDLNPNCLVHTQIVFLKEFFVNLNYEKNLQTTKTYTITQANLKNIFVSPYSTLCYQYGSVGRKLIFSN